MSIVETDQTVIWSVWKKWNFTNEITHIVSIQLTHAILIPTFLIRKPKIMNQTFSNWSSRKTQHLAIETLEAPLIRAYEAPLIRAYSSATIITNSHAETLIQCFHRSQNTGPCKRRLIALGEKDHRPGNTSNKGRTNTGYFYLWWASKLDEPAAPN